MTTSGLDYNDFFASVTAGASSLTTSTTLTSLKHMRRWLSLLIMDWVSGIEHVLAISRTDHFSPFTPSPQVTQLLFESAKVQLIYEMDAQWRFVSNKKNQQWLWYA